MCYNEDMETTSQAFSSTPLTGLEAVFVTENLLDHLDTESTIPVDVRFAHFAAECGLTVRALRATTEAVRRIWEIEAAA